MSLSVLVLRQTVKSVLPQKYLTKVVSVRCSRRGGCEFGEKFLRKPQVGEGLILVIGALFRVDIRRNPG